MLTIHLSLSGEGDSLDSPLSKVLLSFCGGVSGKKRKATNGTTVLVIDSDLSRDFIVFKIDSKVH